MEIGLTDYSHGYFSAIDEALPDFRGGRFIVMEQLGGDRIFVVLSPDELSSQHSIILCRFCRIAGVAVDDDDPQRPLPKEAYSCHGGGYWSIDESTKALRLFGASQAYGGFDRIYLRPGLVIGGYQLMII